MPENLVCSCGFVGPSPGDGASGQGARFGATPACWEAFGRVLAREFESPGLYRAAHALSVDAYACQHSRAQSPKSVAAHLLRLHALLVRGADPARAQEQMQAFAATGRSFPRLEPPAEPGALTVAAVAGAADSEHVERVRAWAQAVWDSWAGHHPAVERWARELP